MNLYILADMEGASGIHKQEHFAEGTGSWKKWGKLCLTEDVRVAAEAARLHGVERVTLRDYHAKGFNILPGRLPDYVKVVTGQFIRPIPVLGEAKEHHMAFLLAQHASQDVPGAFYPHTFHNHVKAIKVNGNKVSEAEILAGAMGEGLNLPVGLISGDPALLKGLEESFPWAEFVPCSKNPKDFETEEAKEKTLNREREDLFQKTTTALNRQKEMKVLRFPAPVQIEVELHFPESPVAKNTWGFKKISDTRFLIQGKSFLNAYEDLFKFLFIAKRIYPFAVRFEPLFKKYSYVKDYCLSRRN